jgi:lambda repressor-like predicted transcriptional regulator
MARPKSDTYDARNAEIVRRYCDPHNPATVADLANDYGLTGTWVRTILDDAGVERRKGEPSRAIRNRNSRLRQIGRNIECYMRKHGLSHVEMSLKMGLSETRLSAALRGSYDWKFTELERLTKALDTSFEDLFKPVEEKV